MYLPLVFTIYILTKQLFHKLRNLPPYPLLSLPLLGHLHLLKKPLYRSLAQIADRYGPVIFFQFGSHRVLVVSSPSAVEDCLSRNDVIFANRPHLLAGKHIGNNYTSLAWSSYGNHWRNLRKVSSIEVLSTHRLQLLHGIRAEEVRSAVRALDRSVEGRDLVDMKTVFFELTMNVMMRIIAGKRYYDKNVEDAEEARRFREIVTETLRMITSHIGDFVPFLRWVRAGGVAKRMVELQRKKNVFMQELKRRFRSNDGGGEETKSFLSLSLSRSLAFSL